MKSSASQSKRTLAGLKLYPYQRRWIKDRARFKIACKARQIGWTFAAALAAVLDRLATPGLTVLLSASERQALEAMEHVRRFVRVGKLLADFEELIFEPQVKAHQVTFQENNSRLIALPANADTVRGFAGDVILDEFAFHRDAEAIWRAIFATVSRGYNLAVLSTPGGSLGKYFELARAAGLVEPTEDQKLAGCWPAGSWSAHWCDIHKAVAEGCPINLAELQAAVGDELTWRQEYLCEFISDAESLIPTEQVVILEDPSLPALRLEPGQIPSPEVLLADHEGRDSIIYLGGDIGRRRDHTLIWTLSRGLFDALLHTRGVVALRNVPFARQREFLDALMPAVHRACFDASGLGMQMVEELGAKWGGKVEPVVFSLASKEIMAMRVVRAFADRGLRVPYAAWIRAGITAVKRYITEAGNIRYDAARTEEGHADEFWALALALSAASGPAISTEYLAPGRGTAAFWLGGGMHLPGVAASLRGGF